MEDVLRALIANGHTLYIATAKSTDNANAVARYFGIIDCFKGILGCGLTRQKYELLADISKMEIGAKMTMIGDRLHDMKAGKTHGCQTIGVLWGYGSREELSAAGANIILEKPEELIKCLEEAAG